jgi:hypothetical protein
MAYIIIIIILLLLLLLYSLETDSIWDVQGAAWLYSRETDSIWDQMVGFCTDGAQT